MAASCENVAHLLGVPTFTIVKFQHVAWIVTVWKNELLQLPLQCVLDGLILYGI